MKTKKQHKIKKSSKNTKAKTAKEFIASRVVIPFSKIIEEYDIPEYIVDIVNSKQSKYFVIGKTSDNTWEVQLEKSPCSASYLKFYKLVICITSQNEELVLAERVKRSLLRRPSRRKKSPFKFTYNPNYEKPKARIIYTPMKG